MTLHFLFWRQLFVLMAIEIKNANLFSIVSSQVPQRKWRNKRSSTNCNHHHYSNSSHKQQYHNSHHAHHHKLAPFFKLTSNELTFGSSHHKSHLNNKSALLTCSNDLEAARRGGGALLFENCKYASRSGASKLLYRHEAHLNKPDQCCRCCCAALKVLVPTSNSSKHSAQRSFSSSESYTTSSSSETSCPSEGGSSEDTTVHHHPRLHHHHSHHYKQQQLFAASSPRHCGRRFSCSKNNMLNIAKACRRFKSATSSSSSSNEDEFDLHELAAILNESLKQWDNTYAAFVRILAIGGNSSKQQSKLQHKHQAATTSQLSTTKTTSSIFKFKYDNNKELNFRKINTISSAEKLTTTTTKTSSSLQHHIALFIQTIANPHKFVCIPLSHLYLPFSSLLIPQARLLQARDCFSLHMQQLRLPNVFWWW